MSELFKYTFNTDVSEDGIYISNDKPLPKMRNFGEWPYMKEPTTEYGDGRCVLWNNRLASAVTYNTNFQKKDIDRGLTYTLKIKFKVIKPLNDNILIGFFRSSGYNCVLNDGLLKGVGPFTKRGKPNDVDSQSKIKCIEYPCFESSNDFKEVIISVNGDMILECMRDNEAEANVYVGIMNFTHRDEEPEDYIAISEISVTQKKAELFFEKIEFHNNIDNNLSVSIRFNHKADGIRIDNNGNKFIINGMTIGLCNTMPLEFEIIKINTGSTVIVRGFKQENINDEISIIPILLGVLDNGERDVIYGESFKFNLTDLYYRYIKENKKIPNEIDKFFKPTTQTKIKLFNKTPINEEFLGFGALYYPWIYLNDDYGRNYTEEQANKELDYLQLSGIRIVRSTIFINYDYFDAENCSWKLEGPRFEGTLKALKAVDERGIDILLNFEWGGSINHSEKVFGDPRFSHLNFDKKCEILGSFVRDFVTALKENGVNRAKYITFFSEPPGGSIDGRDNEEVEAVLYRYKKCIGAAHNALVEAQIRNDYKFVLGNTALGTEWWNSTWQLFAPLQEVLKEYGDEWAYHNYNRYNGSVITNTALEYENMMTSVNADIFEKTGVPAQNVWIDEYNAANFKNTFHTYRNSSGWNAIHIIAGMVANMNVGYKTVLHWTFTNTLWTNSRSNGKDNWVDGYHCWGIIPNLMQEDEPYNSFYAYQIVASHINKGKTYTGENFSESGLCCSACENDDGTFTVVVVNSNVFDQSFELIFEKELNDLKFDRYLYEASKNYRKRKMNVITPNKKISNVVTSLKDTIPGGCVAVYTTNRK